MYRRAGKVADPPWQSAINSPQELKELIALHANVGQLGGDLRSDTVTIIGATLDLQEKTARQVTPHIH